MRLTLTLDDELLAKAEEYTGISNKSALVRESLKKLVERRPPAGWRVSAVASPSSSRSRGGGRNVGDRSIDQRRGASAALVRPHEPRIPPHRRRGSRRDGGSGSCRLARRQAQAREVKLAMPGVPLVGAVRYHDRSDGAQPRNDLSCVIEPTHMGVAGGESAVRRREARIILDREKQFRHCFSEAPTEETGVAY